MARSKITRQQLQEIAATLSRAANDLNAVADEMEDCGMAALLLHAVMFENTHLTAVEEFAAKTKVDSIDQLEAFAKGIKSQVERRHKYHNETVKNRVIGAKAAVKKATKKKA